MNSKPSSPSLSSSPSAGATSKKQKTTERNDPQTNPPAVTESGSLADALRIDRFRLKRAKSRLSAEQYRQRLNASIQRRQARTSANPRIEYPEDLPISQHRDELLMLIQQRQVIVVCGETGSGKSTQLPKILLEAGLGRDAMIGHTQPRRLAARSIATRLAEELDTPLGDLVGYQVRFGDQTSERSLIKSMTDGILLAETQSDRFLDGYDAIIIDEAHERSLNIDFLLGYLRRLQGKRNDLKIIITSATIDAERFAEHFADESGPAPIVNVEGRGYPVEMVYLPWEEVVEEESRGYDLSRHVLAGLESASRRGQGDTLVFLPTERDIREVSHRVAGHYKRLGMAERVDLLPLYARLPQAEQQRIFHPNGAKRRIIFATNVAESSLTVPAIRYVVDAGTARISRYSTRSKMQRLPIEPVSRASADQRAGRCGRIGPGVCVRLYSADDYDARDPFTTPEIRRTNLASVVLQTKTLGLGRLEDFPLLDPPRPEAIREGIRTLVELGALDDRQELTDIGRRLGRLPVDPRVGRIILAAEENGVLPEVLPIAAALEIQDPRDRPPEKRQAADEAHLEFVDPKSDFLSFLRLWKYYEEAKKEHSRNKLTRVLRRQFLSPARMREWSDVYRQLREMAMNSASDEKRQKRSKIGSIRYSDDDKNIVDEDRYGAIHQSLLAGLLSGVAMAGDKNEYTGSGGLKLFLWPGSGVFQSKPKWIVASELVETSKQFARTVARIDPRWIEQVGSHLLKRSHQDPHWSSKSGGAFCYENLFLFGLPIVTRRRVPLPPLDPATARSLLIDHGLVEGQLRTNAKFVRHNQAVQQAIETLAAKTRRRDLVVDSYQIARFYQSRLPEEICDRGRLDKLDRQTARPSWASGSIDAEWVSQQLNHTLAQTDESSLYMRPADLLELETDPVTDGAFPDELVVGKSRLPLEYRFEPGGDRDGVNIKIHQAALSQISEDRLGWLVPGLLEKKLVGMIKSLPKRIRRNLVPAADVAKKIAEELAPQFGQVPFMPVVCEAMSRHAEMPIAAHDFQQEKLDQHLDMLVTVVNDDGDMVAEGRQLGPLQAKLGAASDGPALASSEVVDEAWTRVAMTDFDLEELPREVVRTRGGVQVAQYPGLAVDGKTVSTTLYSDLATAEASIRNGVSRLYALVEQKELRAQVRWLPDLETSKVKLTGLVNATNLETALTGLLARIAFVEKQPVIRTRDDFAERRRDRGSRIAIATQEVASWFTELATNAFAVRKQFEEICRAPRYSNTLADVQSQLDWLLFDDFLSSTPWEWLKHYPRYLHAIDYRLDKLRSGSSARDADCMNTVADLWNTWLQKIPEVQRNPADQSESEFRWMMEELRVSLFAQPLGTSVKVSPQRCQKLLK